MMRAAAAALLLLAIVAGPLRAEGPPRVVAAGGGVTEIVYALGAGDSLVGVDTTSLFPPPARRLPQIGYLRALGAEGILSLRPTLMLAAEDAGPPPVMERLRASGLEVVKLPEGHDPDALSRRIAAIGDALGRSAEGRAMAAVVAADFAALGKALSGLRARPRVLFLLSISASPGAPLGAGRETAAAAMIALAGGENAVDGYRGYKPVSAEAAVAAGPDVLLATRQSVETMGGVDAVLALPQLALTDAAKNRRLVVMDQLYLLGFGPRSAHAARDLAAALHPGLALLPLPERPWLSAGKGGE